MYLNKISANFQQKNTPPEKPKSNIININLTNGNNSNLANGNKSAEKNQNPSPNRPLSGTPKNSTKMTILNNPQSKPAI